MDRILINFIGRTNAGKSSLLNLLSGQNNYAIVDKTAGTTTDNVITVMEIHDLGAVKLIDTAGVDEYSGLGEKKRKKTYEAMEEADLNLLVINPEVAFKQDVNVEKELIRKIDDNEKQFLVIYNIFSTFGEKCMEKINQELGLNKYLKLDATNKNYQKILVEFIKENYIPRDKEIDLLPSLKNNSYVVLIIPMDEETPELRLLRPQNMVVERLLRNFMVPILYRLDLNKARFGSKREVHEEKVRLTELLENLGKTDEGLSLVITDSQAIDIISDYVLPQISLTTFSIIMMNYLSMGNFKYLVDGLSTLQNLKDKDKILIVEACNHDRKCNDIATTQIPSLFKEKLNLDLNIEFNFGRTFPNEEELSDYKMIITCGSCMIDRQKFVARLKKVERLRIPLTNYGLVLSYFKDKSLVERVTKIFC